MKLKRFDEAVWYDYPDGGRLRIKPLSKYDMTQCMLKAKTKMMVRGGNGELVDDYDPAVFSWEEFRTALVEWDRFEFEGSGIPSREAILVAMFQDKDIFKFVLDKAQAGYESENKKLEQEIKNSKSSQDG